MENKLQELTKKLYDEGLSKGRQEAETMVANAKKEAAEIIAQAEKQAQQMRKQAEKQSGDLHKNTVTELELAGRQMTSELKSAISEMIVSSAAKGAVSQAMLDADFIKELLVAVAKNWSGSGSEKVSLKAMLPAEREKELTHALKGSIAKEIGDGVEIEFSDKVRSGVRIVPRNGGYYIDFSDKSFYALLGEYLRPKVSEILFGGPKQDQPRERGLDEQQQK